MTGRVLTPDDARTRILALCMPVETQSIALRESLGHWLAEPLVARRTQPSRDLSAMDGYAVNGSGPWQVVGMSAAGRPWHGTLATGQAARIFTGAAAPTGTQAVVIQEDVVATDASVSRADDKSHILNENIRIAGSDYYAGQQLADPGTRVTPALIGLAAIAGHAQLRVHRRIRVALISTGDELRPVGEGPGRRRHPRVERRHARSTPRRPAV